MKRYTYGPVSSRRLGRSLGIDFFAKKTCNQSCVYCQIGRTKNYSVERREYTPTRDIIAELEAEIPKAETYDALTVAGTGEPTLHSGLADILRATRELSAKPVCVITNSSLLWMPEVRRALSVADMTMPSLDAPDEETFQRINRPAPGVTFQKIIEGLIAFREEYSGEMSLECFLVKGLNDSREQLDLFRTLIQRIKPDRIQLNTVFRPPAEPDILPADLKVAQEILEAEVVLKKIGPKIKAMQKLEDEVSSLLERRPATVEEIAEGLCVSFTEALKAVGALSECGKIKRKEFRGKTYYEAGSSDK